MSGNDLEARYQHALMTICGVIGNPTLPADEVLPAKATNFIRKVCREAMPGHPIWVERARRQAKEKKGITPFMDALDEIDGAGI